MRVTVGVNMDINWVKKLGYRVQVKQPEPGSSDAEPGPSDVGLGPSDTEPGQCETEPS